MTSRAWRRLAPVLLCALAAVPAWALGDDPGVKAVKLAVETQHKLGLATQTLQAASRSASVAGFARVLDPGPLVQLDADIQAAQAAAVASSAEARRARALNASGQALSAKALEAAIAQADADAAKLTLLRRRLNLEWGDGVARLSAGGREGLLADIAAGKAALVRIDTPSGQGLAGLHAVTIDLGPLGVAHARVLGAARTADPHLMSPGLIAEASGPNTASLAIGLATPVKLTASVPITGVVAPQAALLRSQGQTWVYIRTGADTFQREPVQGARPDPMGLFVPQGLKPGQQVVTHGAAALFSAETNVGEEGDD
jgi:hypothetical protein